MESYVELNGARLCYRIAGEQNDQTVLVLHGARGIGYHNSEFEVFLPLASDYRVIFYDHRGHGRSSLTPPYTFEQLADDVEGVRLKLGLGKKIILIGGSFGGMIALVYAIRYPDNLSHLILRGTAPSHHFEAEALQNCMERLDKATSGSVNMVKIIFSDKVKDDVELRLIWLAIQPLYYEHFDPDSVLEKTRKMYFHAETHNALFSSKDYDVRPHLKNIKAPTLVIVGQNDWLCPLSQSEYIAEHVPNAKLLVFENCNHYVHIEENEKFLAAIRDFIEGETAGS